MFVLAELKDTIRITPEQFSLKLTEAIQDEINRKLANKVLLNVGLCISLKDLVSIGDSLILPGDGSSHTDVIFRYIVFRPSIGNVITGKIRSCSREGVHITLGFFDDILIPPSSLQHPSRFEETEQAWVWEYPLADGEKHDLYMDIGEPIKFRVSGELFEESSPIGPPQKEGPSTSKQTEVKIPYKIIGAINESGLGVLSWWDQDNQEEEVAEDEQEQEDDELNGEEDGDGAYEE
uniref:DNA-directed RNA polymerase III subunit RPC8 n=1 Tax=Megaselia scalaris TaxID=36166 RepID=T1GDA6_MEGSC